MKRSLFVSIFGPPMSGKTIIIQLFQKFLKVYDIESVTSWGLDGPPKSKEPVDLKLKALAQKIRVIITETQQHRLSAERRESPENYEVSVEHVAGVGYTVSLTLLGTTLKHNFGDKDPLLKERARSIAARLANDVGTEVIDKIKNDLDPYAQSSKYDDNIKH